MIISSSQVAMQSVQHVRPQFSARQELRIFGGAANDVPDNSSLVQISDIGKAALATFNLAIGNSGMDSGQTSSSPNYAANSSNATSNNNAYTSIDPKMQALIELLQEIFGQTIHLINPADFSHTDQATGTASTPTSTAQGGGAIYNAQTTLTQTTSTSFSAEGDIETSDHQKIHFDLNQSVQTIRQETHSVTIKSGSALKDPLVINFSGNSVQLGQQTFSFDLNNDGKKVTMPFIQGGGYLAYNPDDSGKITDKTQLFGPATGNGFTQLQSLANSLGNNNGWLDQSNPAYSKLGVLMEGSDGKPQFVTLQQAGIGALYLGNVSTHTAIGDSNGNGGSSGELESSGIYLNNNGSVGSMQDVEVNVSPAGSH